jgi:ATP-binding cassette subfamily B protein
MRDDAFENALLQEKAYHDVIKSGDVISLLGEDVRLASQAFSENTAQGLRGLSSTLNGTIMMLRISPKLTFVSLSVVPVLGVSSIFLARQARISNDEFRRTQDEATSFAAERISSISTIKNFSQEQRETQKFKQLTEKTFEAACKAAANDGRFRGILTMSVNTSLLVVMYFGGWLVSRNELTIGSLTSFAMYSGLVGLGSSALSACYSEFSKSLVSAARVFSLMDRRTKMPVGAGEKSSSKNGKPIIEFKGVRFGYPSRPEVEVLHNVSFSVREGEVVCLVGKSGSGKSTIANLITRLYDCDEGSVIFSGSDVRDLELQWFKKQVAVVDQEPTLFEGSLDDNIRYGKSEANAQEVLDAADEANATEFIQAFPEKEKTQVGERGSQLSSGQKQRIAIARAVLKNPPVLILDEGNVHLKNSFFLTFLNLATSFLDSQSKGLVKEAIERLISKGKTIFVIAHHKWPLQYANKILVLDSGRIIFDGSQSELEANADKYKDAYKIIQKMN